MLGRICILTFAECCVFFLNSFAVSFITTKLIRNQIPLPVQYKHNSNDTVVKETEHKTNNTHTRTHARTHALSLSLSLCAEIVPQRASLRFERDRDISRLFARFVTARRSVMC